MNWQAIILTLRLALTVSAVLVIIGLPLAYWIAFSRRRWKFLVESLVAMPLVLPPTVLGFYFLLLLGRGGADQIHRGHDPYCLILCFYRHWCKNSFLLWR